MITETVISKRCQEAAAEYRAECLATGVTPYRGTPIAVSANVTQFALEASEDYRRASEFHASLKNFTMAHWYVFWHRIYSPFPPESGEVDILDLGWDVT